jgi:hypothetical protein
MIRCVSAAKDRALCKWCRMTGYAFANRHFCDAAAVGEAHALGMTRRNRFERGLPDQRIEDLDERLDDLSPDPAAA